MNTTSLNSIGSKFFGRASKMAWWAFGATLSGFIIFPIIGGIIGIFLGFIAWHDPQNHNRALPAFAIGGGLFNVLVPILVFLGIGVFNLCALSICAGMGVQVK